MSACTLSNPCGMEIGALQDHIACGVVCAATFATKDAGDAHRFFSVADAQVMLAKGVFHAIEGYKLCSLRLGTHHDLLASHHVGVKAVHGLAVSHHYVIGDIHDVVDGTETDDAQFVLQPFRTLLNLAVLDAYAGITLTSIGVLYLYLYGQVVTLNGKLATVGAMQGCLIAIALQLRVKVACDTPV